MVLAGGRLRSSGSESVTGVTAGPLIETLGTKGLCGFYSESLTGVQESLEEKGFREGQTLPGCFHDTLGSGSNEFVSVKKANPVGGASASSSVKGR